MVDGDKVKAARAALVEGLIVGKNRRKNNVLAADYLSKAREAEENGELTDDEFLNVLADIERYLWTGKLDD